MSGGWSEGPWVADPDDACKVLDANGVLVADFNAPLVPHPYVQPPADQCRVNVRMARRAPELVAELVAMTDRFERAVIRLGCDQARQGAIDKARALLLAAGWEA